MAFNSSADRSIQISVDLASLVESHVSVIADAQKTARAKSEAAYQQTVIDQGLSYDDQLAFRKQQLKDAKESPGIADEDYIASLESSISSTRKLVKFQKVRDEYLQNYDDLKTGKINLSQHLEFLNQQFRDETDPDIRTQIRDEISTTRAAITTAEGSTLSNRILLAQKDGTLALLGDVIDEVSRKKATADATGDTEASSSYDVSLSALKKQMNETKVSNTLHDIDMQISSTGGTSLQKLDMLTNQINGSDGNVPVTINGTNYASAKEYWTGTRDAYVNGLGSGVFGNFFTDLENETKDKIDTVSKVNKFGFVPTSTLDSIQNTYNTIAARPEFANVADKILSSKVASLSYGVDKSSDAIISSSTDALQLKTGQAALAGFQTRYGIDTTAKQSQLQTSIIQKGAELPSIKAASDQLGKVGAETPSPELAPGASPAEIVKSNVLPENVPGTALPPKKDSTGAPEAAANPAAPAAAAPVVTDPQFKEYTIKASDTLSGIAQSQLGDAKRFKELADSNKILDPNKIVAGMKIKIPLK